MTVARIRVRIKAGVLDPQGSAIKGALKKLGFNDIEDVRVGKLIEIKIKQKEEAQAREQVKQMCDRLLANQVVEDYDFDILED
jgi:phosphoribosylformylglycinamidine synthase PurS subunit